MINLMNKRPEIKKDLDTPTSKAHKFVLRQLRWIDKGYTEEVAFTKTEEELAENFAEARSHSAMLYEIGTSTNIRSFLSYYQQVAEYEGRLKVKQIVKDLPKYLRSTKEFDIFSENPEINEWEKLTISYGANKESGNASKKSFITKVKTLEEHHSEKANKYDGLHGLSDSLILWSARDAYRHLKKTNTDLLQDLEKIGVKLNQNDEIDVSSVENKDLQKAIKLNPMVKNIFKQNYSESYERETVEEVQEAEVDGDIKAKEIEWQTQNPYKQIYGRLDPHQIESQHARIERLKRLWHQSRKNNNESDQFKLQQEAVKALRSVRMKVDQIMVSEKCEPIFSKNKAYTKEEMLSLHRLDIERMGRFLATDKEKVLDIDRDKIEYEEIVSLVKQKTIVEDLEPVGYDKHFGSRLNESKPNDLSSESDDGPENDPLKSDQNDYHGYSD